MIGVLPHLLPFAEQDNLFRNLMAGVPADYLSPDKKYLYATHAKQFGGKDNE